MKIKIWTFIFLLLFGLEIQALNSFSHSVYFDVNQSILSAEEFKKFESYIQNMSKENKVIKIEVLGYCDDIEHESIELNLSKKRSNYIKNKLKKVFSKQQMKWLCTLAEPNAYSITYSLRVLMIQGYHILVLKVNILLVKDLSSIGESRLK